MKAVKRARTRRSSPVPRAAKALEDVGAHARRVEAEFPWQRSNEETLSPVVTELQEREAILKAVLSSTSWQILAPLRALIGQRLWMRQILRHAAKLALRSVSWLPIVSADAGVAPAYVTGDEVIGAIRKPRSGFILYGTSQGWAESSSSNRAERKAPFPRSMASAGRIRFYIEEPEIINGVATCRVNGSLKIKGWALSRDGIAGIHCEVDGIDYGTADRGFRREDVAKAFSDGGWDSPLLSGFEFMLPGRALTEGRREVTIKINSKDGLEEVFTFSIDVAVASEQPGPWSLRKRIPLAERIFTQSLIDQFAIRPRFYIWINCRKANVKELSATLQSVASQSYEFWDVVITGETKTARRVNRTVREEVPHLAAHIRCFLDDDQAEELISQTRPNDLVLPLDAGDILSADALFEFASCTNCEEPPDFIYADERRSNIATGRVEAFFKPDWSPALLHASNYVGRPWCATVGLLRSTVGPLFRGGPVENFDFVLNCTERTSRVAHVQSVLSQRGKYNVESNETEARALKNSFKRRHLNWLVSSGHVQNTYRCRPRAVANNLVSVIVLTCAARGLIKTCIETLRAVGTYKNIEIIVVDNIQNKNSEWKPWLHDNADIVVESMEPFNWSRFNNVGAERASGSYLLFLNDDIEVIQPDWLEALLEPLARKDVAVAGPRLLYPNRKVQHAGMFLAAPALGRHCFRLSAEDDPGYFGLALTQREVIAVTGACLLVKKEVFRSLGGFDERHAIVNNDLDFCLKVHADNLRCVYTPFSQLIHHEAASRMGMKDEYDEEAFSRRWRGLSAKGDPFFHPHLDRMSDDYQMDSEPVERVFPRRPVYDPQAIRRILAVKVDHIGDFVTAFPAFRRLKDAFPAAELIALVAPASVELADLEPSIDLVVPFQFFNARSQLGRAKTDEALLHALAKKLASFKFDLAVDLRRDTDTRELLQLAGAATTAGFDGRNEFPWLDVAPISEGNRPLARMRQHAADDLLNLIDAIVAAGRGEAAGIRRSGGWASLQAPIIASLAEFDLYKRPLVCVHPAAGNATKQWPLRYFADLINLLLATEEIDIVLIGGADEKHIARAIVERVEQRDRVHDLIGRLKLDQLPYFLDTCALFVGNDSGPKHIAAGLGVPTVGIHSGVVDAREWGPLGSSAVALRRNMTCSPCYKATREQCDRGMACLEELTVPHAIRICQQLLRLDRSSPVRNEEQKSESLKRTATMEERKG